MDLFVSDCPLQVLCSLMTGLLLVAPDAPEIDGVSSRYSPVSSGFNEYIEMLLKLSR